MNNNNDNLQKNTNSENLTCNENSIGVYNGLTCDLISPIKAIGVFDSSGCQNLINPLMKSCEPSCITNTKNNNPFYIENFNASNNFNLYDIFIISIILIWLLLSLYKINDYIKK